LAWGTLEQRGVSGAGEKAERYLQKAMQLNPDDRSLLAALAYIEQERGHEKRAGELYARILKIRPQANTAAANLGAIEAKAGNLKDAVKLWEQVFNRVPYRSAVGMNLALAFCESGQTDEARRDVLRVLEFNPDYGKAKRFWAHLNSDPAQCKF
jgi:Flp pilus assembly protein TadD